MINFKIKLPSDNWITFYYLLMHLLSAALIIGIISNLLKYLNFVISFPVQKIMVSHFTTFLMWNNASLP